MGSQTCADNGATGAAWCDGNLQAYCWPRKAQPLTAHYCARTTGRLRLATYCLTLLTAYYRPPATGRPLLAGDFLTTDRRLVSAY